MNVSLRDLLQAGVHFGHQTRRWSPKMRPYIYGSKNGIHIIDLQKTAKGLIDAGRFLTQTVGHGGAVLFVGTKRAAREIVAEEAQRCQMFWVNNRWLGGTLTNWQTVKKSIDRLIQLERARDEGRFDVLTKKEALGATREIEKMNKNLGGIKGMKGLPSVLFIIDPKKEHIAVKEANTLNIPVVALCDTNCDPTGIQYVVPGNDDAIKSIRLFAAAISDSVIEGRALSTGRAAGGQAFAEGEGAATNEEAVEVVRRATGGAPEGAEQPEGEAPVAADASAEPPAAPEAAPVANADADSNADSNAETAPSPTAETPAAPASEGPAPS